MFIASKSARVWYGLTYGAFAAAFQGATPKWYEYLTRREYFNQAADSCTRLLYRRL